MTGCLASTNHRNIQLIKIIRVGGKGICGRQTLRNAFPNIAIEDVESLGFRLLNNSAQSLGNWNTCAGQCSQLPGKSSNLIGFGFAPGCATLASTRGIYIFTQLGKLLVLRLGGFRQSRGTGLTCADFFPALQLGYHSNHNILPLTFHPRITRRICVNHARGLFARAVKSLPFVDRHSKTLGLHQIKLSHAHHFFRRSHTLDDFGHSILP